MVPEPKVVCDRNTLLVAELKLCIDYDNVGRAGKYMVNVWKVVWGK